MAEPHSALDLPLHARVDYLTVLAALAAEDDTVTSTELGALREFCAALELSEEATAQVLSATRQVDPARVRATCERLAGSELRFTLLADLLYLAHTDDDYDASEREVIEGIAALLRVTPDQLDAMERYAVATLRSRGDRATDPAGDDEDFDTESSMQAALIATGVPITALATMSTLGLGFTIGTGLGLAAGLGVGSFFDTKALFKAIHRSRRRP